MPLKKKLSICFVGILVLAFAFIVTRQVVERIRYPQKPIVIGALSKENIKSLSINYPVGVNYVDTKITNFSDINKIIDDINSLGKGNEAPNEIHAGGVTVVNITYKNINTAISMSFYSDGTNSSPLHYMSYSINNTERFTLRVDKAIEDELISYFNKYQK